MNAGQDAMVALVLTEEGVAATKVISGPDSLAVFGIGATEGAVTAGGVVATDEGVAAAQATAVAVDDDSESDDDS